MTAAKHRYEGPGRRSRFALLGPLFSSGTLLFFSGGVGFDRKIQRNSRHRCPILVAVCENWLTVQHHSLYATDPGSLDEDIQHLDCHSKNELYRDAEPIVVQHRHLERSMMRNVARKTPCHRVNAFSPIWRRSSRPPSSTVACAPGTATKPVSCPICAR
ncbi:hypothetical protein BCR34DRAFT_133771 [Clohesyomyces aquaticus]|uniref:Uncharacterized protein n=1 Tax=Clohesyomyces aquaticus TaxID=1231657 RepID=A0A1Y2AC03_9PLEO|nr:hypothetical protein BCR34DRAFT_133771 [Clohesyomyces aquaticus]